MIVCTGGSGTIGQFLPDSVVRLQTRLEESVEAHEKELRALPFIPEAFIHLAALTSVKEAEAQPEKAYDLNVAGTLRWLEAANRVKIPRFIFVSTSHVFKATPSATPLLPTSLVDASSAYGKTKAQAEKAVCDYGGAIQTIIARVFSVTSTKMRDGFLYTELLRRAREKDFRPLPGYQNVRDFIDAAQAARDILKLATENSSERIVHIAGATKSVRALAEEVMQSQGISDQEMVTMFPPSSEPANYLISAKGHA